MLIMIKDDGSREKLGTLVAQITVSTRAFIHKLFSSQRGVIKDQTFINLCQSTCVCLIFLVQKFSIFADKLRKKFTF